MEVLEHVVDWEPELARMARLLTPGGTLIISVPVETGLPVLVKQTVRRIAGWRKVGHYPGTSAVLLVASWFRRVLAGNRQHLVRPVFDTGSGPSHDHKGFNWMVLRDRLSRVRARARGCQPVRVARPAARDSGVVYLSREQPVTTLRVGIVCDYLEERWPSMDLIGDMLMQTLPGVSGGRVEAVQLRPRMNQRWSKLPLIGQSARMHLADRLTGRLWDYPRWLAPRVRDFDVFHVVDHSYAHVMRVLPAERTVVTCNDVDAITAALPATSAIGPEGLLAKSVLDGVSRAAHVACISEATRTELLASGRVDARTHERHLSRRSSELQAVDRMELAATRSTCCMSAARFRARESTCSSRCSQVRASARRTFASSESEVRSRLNSGISRPVSVSLKALSRCRRSVATSLPICIDVQRWCCCRPSVRASGFRSSRRWRVALRSSRAASLRFAKSAAMPPSTVRRATWRPGSTP